MKDFYKLKGHEDGPLIEISSVSVNYSPLVLSGNGWSVEYSLTPQGILTKGAKPTFQQFFDVAKCVNAGGYAIEALYVAACVAFDSMPIVQPPESVGG